MVAVTCRCRLQRWHRGVHVCVGASVGIGACVCVCALACAVEVWVIGAVRDDDVHSLRRVSCWCADDVHICAQFNTHDTMFLVMQVTILLAWTKDVWMPSYQFKHEGDLNFLARTYDPNFFLRWLPRYLFQKESQCWRAASSQTNSILERKANCLHDQWPLAYRRTIASRECPGRLVQNECISFVQPRIGSRYSSDDLSKIEKNGMTTYWSDVKDTQFQSPGMKELKQEYWSKVIKETMSGQKEKWENASSGRQMDSVRKGTPVVLTTGPILIKEHTHPFLLRKRRPRLTEESHIEVAVQEARVLQDWMAENRVKIFLKESTRNRQVIRGTIPYA